MSASYAAPEGTPSAAVEQEQLAPVLVAFAGPAPQSRTTVAFRLFLAIPQFIVLCALAIAAYVITIIGWFAALFTGQLPAFAAEFLTGFLRWQTRVFGYTILLTDEYPPFTLEDADYPIRVAVRPGRLNRLAVLFRMFLLIPAWIVQAVVAYGALTLVQFVSWLIVLISGQMPDTLYRALAAVLRYQARVYGFACMLTSAYPGGLYGDLMTVPGGVPGAPAADEYDAAAEAAMAPWLVVLTAGAKKLMTGFVILGVLLIVGQSALEVVATSNAVTTADASYQVQTDVIPVGNAINDYPADAKACRGALPCSTALDRRVAATLDTYADQVRGIAMPSDRASAAAAALAASTSQVARIFSHLGAATSAIQYLLIASSSGLQQAVAQMNQDYINLRNMLSGS
jgi:Domain of unknown function (DUF4389)